MLWPDGKYQLLTKLQANQLLELDYAQATPKARPAQASSPALLFREASQERGLVYEHRENEYVDFKRQPLLPHMHSRLGPRISIADVNEDGLEDVYVGEASGYSGALFVQKHDGHFTQMPGLVTRSLS